MTIVVNGRRTEHEGTVADLVEAHSGDRRARGIAVALNGVVLARAIWEECRPIDGDRVEIVTAVQGG